jgi:hypothetical protein
MLDPEETMALMHSIHALIAKEALDAARGIVDRAHRFRIEYPPNEQLTAAERAALKLIVDPTDQLELAARKIIASSMGLVIFDLFAMLDGVADPAKAPRTWLGVPISRGPHGNRLALHEEFFPSYWDWASSPP